MIIYQNIVISIETKDFARLNHIDAVDNIPIALWHHSEINVLWLRYNVITALTGECKVFAILHKAYNRWLWLWFWAMS